MNPNPRMAYPEVPANLPGVDLYLPNGLQIRVVPGQPPWIGNSPMPYPRGGPPRVQVPPWNPFEDLRDQVRSLIGGGFR